jgi:hypothetical protein
MGASFWHVSRNLPANARSFGTFAAQGYYGNPSGALSSGGPAVVGIANEPGLFAAPTDFTEIYKDAVRDIRVTQIWS